jgi:hypothetical protein
VTTNKAAAIDALALITLARSEDPVELLKQSLEHLAVRDGESIKDALAREAQLIAVLAQLGAVLVDSYDALAPGRVEAVLQRSALKWAAEGDEV